MTATAAIRGAAERHYPTMSMEEIRELAVSDLADDDAHLYLWLPNSFIGEGTRLFPVWGFRYITALTWVKPSIGCATTSETRPNLSYSRRRIEDPLAAGVPMQVLFGSTPLAAPSPMPTPPHPRRRR